MHPQLAAVQPRPAARLESGNFVTVIADENERRAYGPLQASRRDQADIQLGKAVKREGGGLQEGRPFAAALVLPGLPLLHDVRVKADTGIVDEDMAVHFAHIHGQDLSLQDGGYGGVQRQRYPAILGEMVEGAGRDYAQDRLRADGGLHLGIDNAGFRAKFRDREAAPRPLLRVVRSRRSGMEWRKLMHAVLARPEFRAALFFLFVAGLILVFSLVAEEVTEGETMVFD